jgi:hypothetical protein
MGKGERLMASLRITRDNWLIEAGKMETGQTLYMYPRGDLTQTVALAALDVQYGKHIYDVWTHGESLRVVKNERYRWGEVAARKREAYEAVSEARKRGASEDEIEALKAKRDLLLQIERGVAQRGAFG